MLSPNRIQTELKKMEIEEAVFTILKYVGEDPYREGLKDTPKRVAKAWKEWCSGYGKDPTVEMKAFQDGGENYGEMVLRREIPFFSMCEHHMAPIFGYVTVGYLPNGKVLGLSKVDRVVDIFARRLQVQERLTTQIANTLMDGLQPKGVGVVIKARHFCIESRGVCKHNSETVTSALRGEFMSDEKVRSEFLSLAR